MQSGRSAAPVVAIVGATGAVGIELLGCLERRNFPMSELRLFASARSAGKTLPFRGKPHAVRELTEDGLSGVNIGLFSAGSSTSKRFAPVAVSKGAVVVDNSSAFRMDAGVPLVVPEINPGSVREHKGIIANPNCAAIISITPLWPIHRTNRIRRLTLSTYQAASGAGAGCSQSPERWLILSGQAGSKAQYCRGLDGAGILSARRVRKCWHAYGAAAVDCCATGGQVGPCGSP